MRRMVISEAILNCFKTALHFLHTNMIFCFGIRIWFVCIGRMVWISYNLFGTIITVINTNNYYEQLVNPQIVLPLRTCSGLLYKLPNFFKFREFNRNSYDYVAEVLLVHNFKQIPQPLSWILHMTTLKWHVSAYLHWLIFQLQLYPVDKQPILWVYFEDVGGDPVMTFHRRLKFLM